MHSFMYGTSAAAVLWCSTQWNFYIIGDIS